MSSQIHVTVCHYSTCLVATLDLTLYATGQCHIAVVSVRFVSCKKGHFSLHYTLLLLRMVWCEAPDVRQHTVEESKSGSCVYKISSVFFPCENVP